LNRIAKGSELDYLVGHPELVANRRMRWTCSPFSRAGIGNPCHSCAEILERSGFSELFSQFADKHPDAVLYAPRGVAGLPGGEAFVRNAALKDPKRFEASFVQVLGFSWGGN